MLNIGDVFSNLVGLFLLIAVGYAAVKLQVLPVSSTKLLSNLLMQITLPATILVSLVRPYDAAFIRDGGTHCDTWNGAVPSLWPAVPASLPPFPCR